jgi:hypothetical protein
VLALDADELVPRGERLRAVLSQVPRAPVWALRVVELWRTDPPAIRVDGAWRPRLAPVLYRVPEVLEPAWKIADRRCACPREPIAVSVSRQRRRAGVDLVHLGWADEKEREERAARYLELDGGRFHASAHLESIMWPRERVEIESYEFAPP